MTGTLFSEADAYDGDPLNPDLITVTPLPVVASLTRSQREQRVERLIDQAQTIYNDGLAAHLGSRTVVESCLLFSGGNDSTVLAHLFDRVIGLATVAVHCDTTIGIPQTQQFVRDTCAAWGLPLIVKRPPQTYREWVLEAVDGKPRGLPGPAAHARCFTRLKERSLDLVRHDIGIANSRTKAAVFIAGRRRQESERRKDIPLHEPDGSVIWVSPIAMWTKPDLNTYRLMFGDVPTNEVTDLIHMSGECLCGAYASPGELDEVGYWFPEVKAEINAIEAELTAAGVEWPYNTWGHGQGAPSKSGRLCSSCDVKGQLTFGDVA